MEKDNVTKQYFYDVTVALNSPWSKPVLTYRSPDILNPGAIVNVPFGNKTAYGIVVRNTTDSTDAVLGTIKELERTDGSINQTTLHFLDWMNRYYPAGGTGHVHKFLPSFMHTSFLNQTLEEDEQSKKYKITQSLTDNQQHAIDEICNDRVRGIVLHGVTGSGKTTVYAARIAEELNRGKNVVIIVPEVSLLSQLSSSLQSLLPGVHIRTYTSKQTQKQQATSWQRAYRSKQPTVFLGTRSALFLPYANLSLVIVDEAHEHSLKEDHEASRYHGLRAAAALAKFHKAQFIIGSATPPVVESSLITQTGGKLVCMHSVARSTKDHANSFEIIDMTKRADNTPGQVSTEARESIAESLKQSEQSLVFINKLGSAHLVHCDSCGWQAECPRCDSAFVYHHDQHKYHCRVCFYSRSAENACPTCGSALSTKSLAIKSVENELEKIFPTAKIARFDSTNKKSESINSQYEKVKHGDFDIIVGSQLMAKGFDFPLLSTVVVLNADALLGLPDINAEEKIFSQLLQVSGRVGRGHRDSRVLVQTRQPKNPIYRLIKENDWHALFKRELLRREKHHYPPYTYMAKISVTGSNTNIVQSRCSELIRQLPDNLTPLGPFPAFYEKRNRKYYWQILVKSHDRKKLVELTMYSGKYIHIDLDPVTLL